MILRRLLARWRRDPAPVRADAAVLIMEHGRLAYAVARGRARHERMGQLVGTGMPRRHWDAVRREIKRIEGRL